MAADLPADLKAAIAAMLDGVSRRDLAARAGKLSLAYRSGATSASAITGRADVIAYVVSRLPATYAAISAAMGEVRRAAPEFAPTSVIDVGAGPGTASWAAVATWPGIERVSMIDASRHFINVAGELLEASAHPALANSARTIADVTRFGRDLPEADVVVAGYALGELAEAQAADLIAALWKASRGALILVEPGTPAGFGRIREARGALIAADAALVAPCPHVQACPIVDPDWCHFAERLPRSREHKLAKAADAPFEDEKFSYVVAAREIVDVAPYSARVLAPPKSSKAELRLKLCTSEGTIAERAIPRRDREAYAQLRRVWWGDAVAGGGQSGSRTPASA